MAAERGTLHVAMLATYPTLGTKKPPTHDCSIRSEILNFQPGKQVAACCRNILTECSH